MTDGFTADTYDKILEHIEAAELHKSLASGYEQTGAYDSEVRELVRGMYHQNQAILMAIAQLGQQSQ